MELFSNGVITDPLTLIRGLDLPGVDIILQSMDQDIKVQHRENGKLLDGEIVEVKPWHNHMIHIAEINKLRNSIDYEEADEEIQRVVDDHAAAHEALVLPQLGVPTPPGTEQQGENPGLAAAGLGSGAPEYTDPMTGSTPDPTQAAAGKTPSGLANSRMGRRDGIGGPKAEQGRVSGIPREEQQRLTGS
jgi:hypothetical protein